MSGRPGRNRQAEPVLDRVADPDSAPVAESLEQKLARARRPHPPAGVKCQACWVQGWDAAVKAARTGGLEAARTVSPAARDYQHDRSGFDQGRDAFLELLAA